MLNKALILYANGTGEAARRLEKIVLAKAEEAQTEIYSTIYDLCKRLRQPTYTIAVIVLLAKTPQDLRDIYSIRNFFQDLSIILILPDNEEYTVTKGLKLYPRFLSCVENDLTDVAIVLGKMLSLFSV